MTYMPKPKVSHPGLPRNELGLTRRDYEGVLSTLCAGCGHDSITAAIIEAAWEMSLPAHRVAKMSGIGCSSKTPAYFLGAAHGFNSVHGRMPSVATGAYCANRDLVYLGVSGDGDTVSIGLGQFAHGIRRRLRMLYIVENNGCYGLTKGQFSATADPTSKSKKGESTPFAAIDPALFAISMGATFVARSFSGDKEQLVPLIKAGLSHKGFALIDVVSPCVTFNNHEGSTKSYDWVRAHEEEVTEIVDHIPTRTEITTSYKPGEIQDVVMHDGSMIRLRKLASDYDLHDPVAASTWIQRRHAEGEIVTGLLYLDQNPLELHDVLGTVPGPLRDQPWETLCPGSAALSKINAGLR
jgi:2-oxoglutarate ferredoxin oxidoreductase subunit beta